LGIDFGAESAGEIAHKRTITLRQPYQSKPDHLPRIDILPQVAALCADNAADIHPAPDNFTPQEARDISLISNPVKIRNESDSKIIHIPGPARAFRAIEKTGSDDG